MTVLYDQDYGLWAEQMADLLLAGRFGELDIENLVEEVRDLSKRERDRLLSSMRLIVQHLLKWDYQPHRRSRSWQITIQRERLHIIRYLKDSPSLKRYLNDEWLNETYVVASLNARKETDLEFPANCPYSVEDVLERPINLD
ncbi:MAG: DUF29 domain-containing protein [Pseudanabaena sp.]|jgi:hypothetical protein|nr:DUF29 domain-containing protein [Pseudanabaena sp. M53BS1SP1A06MG]MCA6580763.1 DUF29 domain-containing protein [Pseudanabaena sp. M34BS1SP1A06MG]MCA6586361.1 DUF29 domain-containing protein [Pseudanabaena sp. M051S1SP1A06QC]MCA6591602.1 DUF29 domain-containing protein [Pseudanabaena sp. M38BS1SP1A06MG]MCA6595758.1 DUF29 domain-containing protein [Pseudanabaena sp. M046S1SP1A06QC]MCA6599867.1 DUF29 domain-containing protein [Pseudanabaena sp. M57BS1SP1A06MG]MCA6610656.1 DUF29 domain-contain